MSESSSDRRQWDARPRGPVGQLPPQDWMQRPETQAVVDALQARGQAVRFVGGCVRDGLLHRPVKDVDIATPDPPETVMALLEAAGLKAVPTGIEHGTVTAVAGGRPYEITTLRKDVETDGRHAQVAWTSDWMADAARRDFTINAMSARPDGAVYDYFDGLHHLAHGRVVFVGRPMARIREDYLRILRFFRFYARYGRYPPDADAYKACLALAPHLRELSVERVRTEMLQILDTDAAADVVVLMRGARVLDAILPEARDIGRLRQLVFLETRGLRLPGIGADPLRRLGALFENGPADGQAVAERWKMSTADSRRLIAMLDLDAAPAPDMTPAARRGMLHELGRQTFTDRLLLAWSAWRAVEAHVDSRLTAAYVAMLEEAETWEPPAFPLRGGDLIALGVPKGPQVGRLMTELLAWWRALGCAPDRAAVLAEARRRLDGARSDRGA